MRGASAELLTPLLRLRLPIADCRLPIAEAVRTRFLAALGMTPALGNPIADRRSPALFTP
jgi:hypothetical protein